MSENEEFEFRLRLEKERGSSGKPAKSEAATEKPQSLTDMALNAKIPILGGANLRDIGNFGAGFLQGAGRIGATIAYPVDKAIDLYKGDREQNLASTLTGKKPLSRNEERRQGIADGLRSMGADTDSALYEVGDVGAQIAGTAGVGGALAKGALASPRIAAAAPNMIKSIQTAGMSGGATTGATNALTRAAGGAITGGTAAGLIDPDSATTGAAVGAALPLAGASLSALKSARKTAAETLMQSAIKPTIAQRKSGDADIAIKTLLENGVNPTKSGVNKLRELIDDLDDQIADRISNSTATISKQKVIDGLGSTVAKFKKQVSPTSDLNAIQGAADDFAAHPSISGDAIPVQLAQELKQGTYKVLSKKYGQIGSADTEAQKGLARGLKEGVADAVPGIAGLNAEESRLITTLGVAERRALLELNKNPMGLSLLSGSPGAWAAFMADRSALFKSLAARMVNPGSGGGNAITNAASKSAYKLAPVAAAEYNQQ